MPTTADLQQRTVTDDQTQERDASRYDDGYPQLPLLSTRAFIVVRVIATANVAPLTGAATVDGIALANYDLVLLSAQSDDSENGTWQKRPGAWIRTDNPDAPGALYSVLEGTNAGIWRWEIDGTFLQVWAA